MLTRLSALREIVSNHENVHEIYDAMKTEDLSNVVLSALKVIKQGNAAQWTAVENIVKSERESEGQRLIGNKVFVKNKFQHALMLYNQSILHAPKDSRAMKFAISNRSALLCRLKVIKACLNDIEKCMSMGCPPEVLEKLNRRKEEMIPSLENYEMNTDLLEGCAENFLNTKFVSHPEVPCVSQDVEFVGTVVPKIVASRDIKVGTVIAREKAYVSYTNPCNALFACHYCQKMSLNLMPCDSCCTAMFCTEECKRVCYEEYHKYECHIIDAIKLLCNYSLAHLMMKAIFKMRSKCSSWDEIIKESKTVGLERMADSSNEEIFSPDYLFSVLNARDDRVFAHGLIYNGGIICSVLLLFIEKVPSFWPDSEEEKKKAVKAIARIMLFFYVHQTTTFIYQTVTNIEDKLNYIHQSESSAIFTFTGKLKHSCTPNLFAINNNNEMILMTIRSIKAGEELTLAKPVNILDSRVPKSHRNISYFLFSGKVCMCAICCDDNSRLDKLSDEQKEHFNSLDLQKLNLSFNVYKNVAFDIARFDCPVFNKILKAMDVLNNVTHTNEYKEVYERFRKCVMFYESIIGQNYVLEKF